MKTLLLITAAFLAAFHAAVPPQRGQVGQGNPALVQQAGTVTGVLKDSDGQPLPGVRMAAVARPDSITDLATVSTMAAVAETDAEGRYKLENIPPGRYFIAAGRLDVQTYFPGTPDADGAKEVAVVAGATVAGIDFALSDFSYGRIGTSITLALPFRASVEGGGALPVSGNGALTALELELASGNANSIWTVITNNSVNILGPQRLAYRVSVINLPDTYVVKSMTYGATDLLKDPLRLNPSDFPAIRSQAALGVLTLAPDGTLQMSTQVGNSTSLSAAQQNTAAAITDYVQALLNAKYGASLQGATGVVAPPLPPPTAPATPVASAPSRPRPILTITFAKVAPKVTTGVRVSGKIGTGGPRAVYLSGIPGAVYADGTFEVYGVPPGRHTIVTLLNPSGSKPTAALIVVGDQDLDGIVLAETSLLPASSTTLQGPRPAGSYPPGPIPLARISGTILEEVSHQPVPTGTILVKGESYPGLSLAVDSDGHFETLPLLPGVYLFEVQVFGHSTIRESVEVDDKDIRIELHSLKLY